MQAYGDPSKVFCGTGRAAAVARVLVRRGMRRMCLPVPETNEELAEAFITAPWQFSDGISRALQESAKAWERNDHAEEQAKAEAVEILMALLNVKLDWPGLYPTYKYTGKVPAGVYVVEGYQLSHVWSTIKEIREKGQA